MKTIVIEDDLNIRKGLVILLNRFAPQFQIVAQAATVQEGYEIIAANLPDLLFLDIQLPDGSSFDILEQLRTNFPQYTPKLVFITAYEEYALKALKMSALDYLLKPIDPKEIEQVCEKINNQPVSPYAQVELLLANLNKTASPKRISLQTQVKTYIVEIADIIRCESSGNYTTFYSKDGEKIMVSKTLKDYETLLSQEGFFRIHQSHLINLKYIKSFDKKEQFFIMTDGAEVPISNRNKELVNDIIKQLTI